jgi:outer membrane protein
MSMHTRAFICLLALCAGFARADSADDCAGTSGESGPSDDCVAVGKWNFSVALGAGERTNPVVGHADIPLVVIPHVSYYGKRFFIDNLDVGFTLAENAVNTLSLVASPGYDRVFFYRSDLQNIFVTGLPTASADAPVFYARVPKNTPDAMPIPPSPRHATYLAGPEYTFKLHGISGQLDVLHDITDQDNGTEVRAAVGVSLIRSHGSLSANAGFTWKSAGIVNYYYGVPTVYRAGPTLDPFVKLGYTVPLSGHWQFSAFAQYEHMGSAIADSPIVAEHYVATAFVGANYTF